MAAMEFDIGFGITKIKVFVYKERPERLKDADGLYVGNPHRIMFNNGWETFLPELLGEIHLLRECLGVGYVTHELTHALGHYLEVLGGWEKKNEEHLCYTMGDAATSFWNQYYEVIENE